VRAAAAALEKEQLGAQDTALSWFVQYEQTWGVQVSVQEGALKEGEALLAGYRRDASHIVYPKTLQGAIYALVMPLQAGVGEEAAAGRAHSSISIVCSDLLLQTHPWAAPLDAQVLLPGFRREGLGFRVCCLLTPAGFGTRWGGFVGGLGGVARYR